MRPGPKQEWTVRSIRQDRFAARALGRVGFESTLARPSKFAPAKLQSKTLARCSRASPKMAPVQAHFFRPASGKCAWRRLAPRKQAYRSRASVKFALANKACDKSALMSVALLDSAKCRFAPLRLASDLRASLKFADCKSPRCRLTLSRSASLSMAPFRRARRPSGCCSTQAA